MYTTFLKLLLTFFTIFFYWLVPNTSLSVPTSPIFFIFCLWWGGKGCIINSQIISEFKTIEIYYFSINAVIDSEESIHFLIEILNFQIPSGMPPHKILLKVGVPNILLRNLNSPRLCNGTRLRNTSLTKNVPDWSRYFDRMC
jgi:hypothetical protein